MPRLFLLILCLGLFACDHQHDHGDHGAGHGHDHETAADSALTLNAGRKWASDSSTRAGMERMQEIALQARKTLEPNAKLAERLEAELARLVRECTMQGPAHNMLHIYLAGLTEVIEALKNEDPAIARAGFDRLNPVLMQFDVYFE